MLATPEPHKPNAWCPLCDKQVRLLRVTNAARLIDVHTRTIYRYIDEGLVYAVKVVGKTYRVCGDCLFRQNGLN
ncbi:MAG: helix-turn-helix domain-containing protein [Acidobacteria bacterium]|nr:helix-turn-helix domain-containing protein [Acidobacteriota bacterium]